MKGITFFIFLQAVNNNLNVIGVNNDIYNNIDYVPTWNELDTRPLPKWYDYSKIGIFIHWGVYSVPSFKSEWFWFLWKRAGLQEVQNFVQNTYGNDFVYEDFTPMFKASKFDPEEWANLFLRSGAKYVVLTAKHHDGFTLFPSGRPQWNSVDIGPKKDIVRILSQSIRKRGLKFGVYYSLLEWFNPLYLKDIEANEETTVYTDKIVWPDIKLLINKYKPSVLWLDGDEDVTCNCFPSCRYWKSRELLAWLYNESPVKDEIVVNDRWGNGTRCHHGDFYNCDDAYNPRKLMGHKWENAFSLDKLSWGYRRDMEVKDVLTFSELLETVVSTVSCGGNALINVGPTKDGIIVPIFQERLLQLGGWLKVNGEAMYDTIPWLYQKDSLNPDVWYTRKAIDLVYAIFLKYPDDNILFIKDVTSHVRSEQTRIYMIHPVEDDSKEKTVKRTSPYMSVTYEIYYNVLQVYLPNYTFNMSAWVLKIEFK